MITKIRPENILDKKASIIYGISSIDSPDNRRQKRTASSADFLRRESFLFR